MQNKPEDKSTKNIFIVNKDCHGQRVDNFLLKILKDINKSNIYKLLRKGQIRVNGKRTKPLYRLQVDDKVRVPPFLLPDKEGEIYISESLLKQVRESIIFENKNYVVVNKPSGLAVHTGTGIKVGLIEVCQRLFKDIDIQLAHRLDRDTSGCVVLSKNRAALNHFNEQSKQNQLVKKYMVLVKGVVKNDFIVDFALDVSNRHHGERTVVVSDNGKWAKTQFRVSEYYQGQIKATLLQGQLFSGRTHQIRVHASASDLPLAGDSRYGDEKFNTKMRKVGLKRLFLHASVIEFNDGDEDVIVTAELPAQLDKVLNQL